MNLPLTVPDHTTVSRRATTLPPLPRIPAEGELHILIDSTGLKVYGAGQWLEEKHGVRARRDWRKLHLAVDADNFNIVAHTLTDSHTDDPPQVGQLLSQTEGPVVQVTADGLTMVAPRTASLPTMAKTSLLPSLPVPPRWRTSARGHPVSGTGTWPQYRIRDGWPGRRLSGTENGR
ncbi:hypothetical protein FHR25_004808 [Yokenella regensburgei]|nr:hypothetical protein FHR25_004808 [Yokenella regensburgei]